MMTLGFSLIGSAGQIAAAPRTLVFFGDSLTAGYGIDPAQAYPALIQAKLREASLDYDVINAGISGDTSSGGLARLDWAETRKNLAAILARVHAKYPQAKLVVAGMQLPPNLGAVYVAEFRAIFPEVARDAGAALVPFLLEGVAAQPSLNQADMMHPTPAGQQVVANNVWTVLRPLL